MTFYQVLLFLHVPSAVGIFVAWGMEAVVLGQRRYATAIDQTRSSPSESGSWVS